MEKSLILFLSAIMFLGLGACSDEQPEPEHVYPPVDLHQTALTMNQIAFFENVSRFCGETFIGESTFPENDDHVLVGTELRAHLSECDERIIRIELYRGGDYWHGAWVLEQRDDGLHLFHDHLGEVRSMEDLGDDEAHGYGGYATDSGSATRQYFAADDATAEILPEAATNVWMLELEPENERFIYYLERHDEPRFRAEFERQ
ncbi:MAG: hypothetical protein ACQETM_09190 [Bacteroidota bacterium]